MIELLKRRYQVKKYTDDIPDYELIKDLIEQTYDVVASHRNLVPYKIHVLGPDCEDEKQNILEETTHRIGGGGNINILAPYNLIFTNRLVTNPNGYVKYLISKGHPYIATDVDRYKDNKDVLIEIGMFSAILTSLCIEHNLGVSYQRCLLSDWTYEGEPVIFSMQTGYPAHERIELRDFKPEISDVLNFK